MKLMRKITLVVFAVLVSGVAAASTYTVLSERAMTRQADAIVLGRVVDTRSKWIGKTLVTLVDVKVDETLKGPSKGMVEVVVPGGIDANRRVPVAMTYPGAPRLLPDERVALFLESTPVKAGAMMVSGYAQGKYSIVSDGSGRSVVTRNPSVAGGVGSAALREGSTERRTLQEFRRQIQGYLNTSR